MKRFVIGCAIAALAIGCSAKQLREAEEVTGKICTGARELQAQIALGIALVPSEDVAYWSGLSYRATLVACDERDAYLAR